MFKIVQITEANDRIELASDLPWREALTLAISIVARDRTACRYEILDLNGDIVFESYAKSARGTRGFILHKKPRSQNAVN
jgi:hypothetical protein